MGLSHGKGVSRNVCRNKLLSPLLPWRSKQPPPDIHTHFLAKLFLGLSLTSTANQAYSDKALKSSA